MLIPIQETAQGSADSLSTWQHKAQRGKINGVTMIGRRYYTFTEPEDLEYLSVAEYASLVGRTPAAIRRRIGRNGIPGAIYCGTQWVIPRDAEYVDRRGRWERPQPEEEDSRPAVRTPIISNLNVLFRGNR